MKLRVLNDNGVMYGGHEKKQENLREDIYVISYAILRPLGSLENLKMPEEESF